MATFVVIQMCIETEIKQGNTATYNMINVVRIIEADSKEMAIGKFVVGTSEIKTNKKLEIECYNILDLKTIN